MKIEVGKFYKTRDGNKARIYCVDAHDVYCVQGAIYLDHCWNIATWKANGRWSNDVSLNNSSDLVSEWEELGSKLLAYVSRTVTEGGRASVVLCREDACIDDDLYERVPWLDEPAERSEAL